MAIRTNCVEYGYESSDTRVLSGSWFNTSYKSIYIPEAGKTFNDVILVFHGRNDGGQVGNFAASYSISCQIDNQPSASIQAGNIANSTIEQISYTFRGDFTSYFSTYFTASSHNVRLGFNGLNSNTIGQSFKLLFNYSFDDATTTNSIKTIRLPINTITSSGLSTPFQYLGNYTASIPALDSYLPENGKAYKDIFLEYHANDAASNTTTFRLQTKIDNGATTTRYAVSQSLNSAAYYYEIDTLSGSIDTSTTHSIQVASTTAARFTGLCGILYCTYEYDYTGSTRILNSNIISLANSGIYAVKNNYFAFFAKRMYIPESNVSLGRSAIYGTYTGAQRSTVRIGLNTSSVQSFDLINGTLQTGYLPFIVQLDGTGSSIGSISVTSGYNDFKIYLSATETNQPSNVFGGAVMYLNYFSDVGTRPLYNNVTVPYLLLPSYTLPALTIGFFYHSYIASASISNAAYYITDCVNQFNTHHGAITNAPIYNIAKFVCFYTGSDNCDSARENPFPLSEIGAFNDSRYLSAELFYDMTPYLQLYPNYIADSRNTKLKISDARTFGFRNVSATTNAASNISHLMYLTFHSHTFNVTGSIQNYSGTGAGISLTVFNYDTGEKLFVTSSKSGGLIDTFWYDKHSNLIIMAETGSNRYMSNVLPAGSGSFSIIIPTQSTGSQGSTEKSFTFIG